MLHCDSAWRFDDGVVEVFGDFSRNIAEFWRRWHISLSTWFKDYVLLADYIGLKPDVDWVEARGETSYLARGVGLDHE